MPANPPRTRSLLARRRLGLYLRWYRGGDSTSLSVIKKNLPALLHLKRRLRKGAVLGSNFGAVSWCPCLPAVASVLCLGSGARRYHSECFSCVFACLFDFFQISTAEREQSIVRDRQPRRLRTPCHLIAAHGIQLLYEVPSRFIFQQHGVQMQWWKGPRLLWGSRKVSFCSR